MTYYVFGGTVSNRQLKPVQSVDVVLSIRPSTEDLQFKMTDVQFQEGQHQTLHDLAPKEFFYEPNENFHYNAICRGDTVMIVPYHSEIPYNTAGAVSCIESGYVSSPMVVEQQHYPSIGARTIKMTQGLSMIENTEGAKGYYNNTAVGYNQKLKVDGSVSQSYLNGTRGNYHFGQFLRIANADAKFKVHTDEVRTKSDILFSYQSTMKGIENDG